MTDEKNEESESWRLLLEIVAGVKRRALLLFTLLSSLMVVGSRYPYYMNIASQTLFSTTLSAFYSTTYVMSHAPFIRPLLVSKPLPAN
jgi:hypothetical protein